MNVLDLSTNYINTIEPIKDAEYINISLSPDQSKIVFEVMGGNMYKINVDGSGLTDLGKGNRPKWSPDSKNITYMITDDNGYEIISSDIYLINSDGSEKINLTNSNNSNNSNPENNNNYLSIFKIIIYVIV